MSPCTLPHSWFSHIMPNNFFVSVNWTFIYLHEQQKTAEGRYIVKLVKRAASVTGELGVMLFSSLRPCVMTSMDPQISANAPIPCVLCSTHLRLFRKGAIGTTLTSTDLNISHYWNNYNANCPVYYRSQTIFCQNSVKVLSTDAMTKPNNWSIEVRG